VFQIGTSVQDLDFKIDLIHLIREHQLLRGP